MTQKITITGVGYGVSFVELTDEELESFLEEIEEVVEPADIKVVADLVGNSYYEYGFKVDDDLRVDVDGRDESDTLKKLIESKEVSPANLINSKNVNLLVYEAEEYIHHTISSDYDPNKFEFIKHELILPNGLTKTIVDLYYGNEGFDGCDTTSRGHVYIVKKDGEVITF